MKIVSFLLSALTLTITFACNNGASNGTDPTSVEQAPDKDLGNTPAGLGFDQVNVSVVGPKCATCHSTAGGNRGGVNLETYENIVANREAIAATVNEGFMPPRTASALTGNEKASLLAWLAAGAPRVAVGPTPTVSITPDVGPVAPPVVLDPVVEPAASFAVVFEKVIAPRCVACHGTRGDINLESYEQVFVNRQAIMDVVDAGTMPPKRKGPLTPVEKDLLVRWIQAGASFN